MKLNVTRGSECKLGVDRSVCAEPVLVNAACALIGVAWPGEVNCAWSEWLSQARLCSLQSTGLSLPGILAGPLQDDNVSTAFPAFCTVPVSPTCPHLGDLGSPACFGNAEHSQGAIVGCDTGSELQAVWFLPRMSLVV